MAFFQTAKIIGGQARIAYLALFDHRTPKLAKLLLIFAIAYFLSPIDLIPDFIPLFGLLDELLVIPLLLTLALYLVPHELRNEFKRDQSSSLDNSPLLSRLGLIGVVFIWLALTVSMAIVLAG